MYGVICCLQLPDGPLFKEVAMIFGASHCVDSSFISGVVSTAATLWPSLTCLALRSFRCLNLLLHGSSCRFEWRGNSRTEVFNCTPGIPMLLLKSGKYKIYSFLSIGKIFSIPV